MLKTRVIPCLLLKGNGLVKTERFKNPRYIGDPINAVRIFNDKEVDELILLDILATIEKRPINFKLIAEIATEAFMPLGYGGGIHHITDIEKLFKLGIEKVVLNTACFESPTLIEDAAKIFGSQSIVASIDVKANWRGKYEVWVGGGQVNTKIDPVSFAEMVQNMGVGEIFLNSIDREGTFKGFDLKLIKEVSMKSSVPLIASGGASSLDDFKLAVQEGGASAVSAGSFFVYQGIHHAVLITYPSYNILEELFSS